MGCRTTPWKTSWRLACRATPGRGPVSLRLNLVSAGCLPPPCYGLGAAPKILFELEDTPARAPSFQRGLGASGDYPRSAGPAVLRCPDTGNLTHEEVTGHNRIGEGASEQAWGGEDPHEAASPPLAWGDRVERRLDAFIDRVRPKWADRVEARMDAFADRIGWK